MSQKHWSKVQLLHEVVKIQTSLSKVNTAITAIAGMPVLKRRWCAIYMAMRLANVGTRYGKSIN